MERRDFLKNTTIFSIGGLLIPSLLLDSCRKNDLFEDVDFEGKVIIIGAGAAGLYAGYLLKQKGIDFIILEASASHGGRMGKLAGFADYDIDTGAQWLHGKNNILGDLVKVKNVKITKDDSDLSYFFNDQIVEHLPKDPFIFEEENLPDISFKDYATSQGFGAEYSNIIEAIAGDQGASASLLSAYWNSKDEENWVSGADDFKFQETFFDFIDKHIAQEVIDKIRFNTAISSINYQDAAIELSDASNAKYSADKVILTVPISILKLGEINFVPVLPVNKTQAFAKFGMGPGMKVFLKFSMKFYVPALYGGAVCGAYIDDTVGKSANDHILLAFVMGDQAASLHALGSDVGILNAILQELDLIYDGQATLNYLNGVVFDYTDRPFIKGAYGFSTIEMGDSRKVAAESVDGKLFFAGEAMNTNGHHQTVHGAVESGYKAVIDIFKSLKK